MSLIIEETECNSINYQPQKKHFQIKLYYGIESLNTALIQVISQAKYEAAIQVLEEFQEYTWFTKYLIILSKISKL